MAQTQTQDALGKALVDLLGRAAPLISDRRKALQWRCETECRRGTWARHVQEGQRLQAAAPRLRACEMTSYLRALWRQLETAIHLCHHKLSTIADSIPSNQRTQAVGEHQQQVLRIGCANPHSLGCANVIGDIVRLRPLLDVHTGVAAAVTKL